MLKGATERSKLSSAKAGCCFKCGSPDHLQKDCPKSISREGKGLMAEIDENTEQLGDPIYDDYEDDEGVELDGDTGDMLVRERALIIPSKKDEDRR